MPSIIACCRDVLAVAGWLASWSSAGGPAAGQLPAEVIWHLPGEGRGTPAFHGGTAFFLSKHHELVALDARSGVVRWRRPTNGPGATTAGTAVVVTPTDVIAGDGGLISFTHSGVKRWRVSPAQLGNAGIYLGELAGETLLAGSSTGHLWALDARSGSLRWSLGTTQGRATTVFAPIVAGGIVVASFAALDDLRHGGLVAADLTTGRQLWRRSGGFAGVPLAAGAVVLAAGRDGSIHAFDRTSGATRWLVRSHPASIEPHEFRTLTLAGSRLVAGSLTGVVTAYDLATQQELWRSAPMTASIVFGMASDGHTVYVPYLSGRLIALGAEDGSERWRTGSDSFGFSWKPLIIPGLAGQAGRLLAASSSAGFFAFRL